MKHKKTQKSFAIWIILAIIIIGALVFYFLKTPAQPSTDTNITDTTTPTGAKFGDLVTINFILELENGTIVDANDEQLAKENNIKDYVKGPYTFILGQSGKVPGFDEALIGMSPGDHRETIIQPSEKEIILNVNKTKIIPRFITILKKQAFPAKSFQATFGKKPILNDIVFMDRFAFKYKIINISNETIITEIYAKEKEEYTLPNTEWKSIVAKIEEEDILFYQKPKENQTLDTEFGPATINLSSSRIFINFEPELYKIFNRSISIGPGFSIPQQFRIEEIKDDYFVIKRYGVLADKKLKITADMIEITPDVKEVKRDVKVTEVVKGTEN
ncbi:FKBP-type peptidyl-prolyl cis-trans isomerase [Candidatus Woesearchaeota archaeon]|nr:FKBP-type peptidyl-prolyl cis-trans isomerase [Candidatus Woesearchaeota archaeon]